MYYKKIKTEHNTIEFHNNWLGTETIIINGQIVSKKSSIMGADHFFSLIEDGHSVRYVLTTKVNANMQVLIDLRKNGKLLEENIIVPYGGRPRARKNPFKMSGITQLKEYDIAEAVETLNKGLDINIEDPEIYFYLACCYSIEEKSLEGFNCLKNAVKYNLQNIEMILNHEMLAFLRMEEEFEGFLNSNFTKFDPKKLSDYKEE